MKVAVHGREVTQKTLPYISQLLEKLLELQSIIYLSDRLNEILQNTTIDLSHCHEYKSDRFVPDTDFVISFGGDGTLLETVTHVGPKEIPILGINAGRLGFLATTSGEEIIPTLNAIAEGKYTSEPRTLIHLESNKDLFNGLNFGLNDFTILKKDTSSMIVVHTFIDGSYLNSYWADGLIVATPTGSTGYSLSCGGPVVLPQSNNLVITPVSPHNLTVRPLIVSGESHISFSIEGRSKNFLISLDSRSRSVNPSVEMAIRKESFYARLVKVDGYNYLDTLRQKLKWGLDIRN